MTRPTAPGPARPITCSSCGAQPDQLTPLEGADWTGRPFMLLARCPACGGEIGVLWRDRGALTSYPKLIVGPGGWVGREGERR